MKVNGQEANVQLLKCVSRCPNNYITMSHKTVHKKINVDQISHGTAHILLYLLQILLLHSQHANKVLSQKQPYYKEKIMAIFPSKPGLASYIGAKDDGSGGDNWSYKTCEAPVKSSPATNQHPTFYRPDAIPVAQRTAS